MKELRKRNPFAEGLKAAKPRGVEGVEAGGGSDRVRTVKAQSGTKAQDSAAITGNILGGSPMIRSVDMGC